MLRAIAGHVAAAFVLATVARGATIVVDLQGGGDFTSIQAAIDAAKSGDTVLVNPSEYVITAPISFKRKAITLASVAGPEGTTIRMADTPSDPSRGSVVVFETKEGPSSVLEGFTLTGGKGSGVPQAVPVPLVGGGIACFGASPTVRRCAIVENTAAGGGGVCLDGSSATFEGCNISRNEALSFWPAGSGGGVLCGNSSPRFADCTVEDNLAAYGRDPAGAQGGGLYFTHSSPTLENCRILGNRSLERGGGVTLEFSPGTLTHCTIAENCTGGEGGGGLYIRADSENQRVTIESCIVWGNPGGSHYSWSGSPKVFRSCIEGPEVLPGTGNTNEDPRFCGWGPGRGEVWVDGSRAGPGDGTEANPYRDLESATGGYSVALSAESPCLAKGMAGSNMGAEAGTCDAAGEPALVVHVAPGVYSAVGLDLTPGVSLEGAGPESTAIEGTIWGLGRGAHLSGVKVTKGTLGGIIVSPGESVEIADCAIVENLAQGLLCCLGSSLILTDSTISRNAGGGMACGWASADVRGCTISENVTGAGGGGVVIWGCGSFTMTDCRVSGNSATNEGGGFYVYQPGGPIAITNTWILGNVSQITGGAIWFSGSGQTATLTNCVIAGNLARKGAVMDCSECAGMLTNCTVSGNFDPFHDATLSCFGDDPGDTGLALRNCILPVISPWPFACPEADTCLVGEDPVFVNPGEFDFSRNKKVAIGGAQVELPDFIVEEPDFHLLPGSVAIDAGASEGAPETDIEGNPRPCEEGVDIGAYEFCEGVRFLRGDPDANGAVNLTDAVFTLNHLFLSGPAPSCLDAGDADDDGKLSITDGIHVLNYLFLGGPAPPAPFPGCAAEAGDDALGCAGYSGCK